MKTVFVLLMTLISASSFAATAQKSVSKNEILRSIALDTIGRAALKQLKGCAITLVKAPAGDFDDYEVEGSCSEEPNEYTGGGVYLSIKIKGEYYGSGSGELKSVEAMHAG